MVERKNQKVFRLAGIEKDSVVDGEGWRYVIFFQGCSHNCKGCHNTQTHSFSGGRETTEEEILADLQECNKEHFMEITLSGGDPFFQAKDIIHLCKKLKELNYNIWAYTGFVFEDFLNHKNGQNTNKHVTPDMVELLQYIDVLVDGPYMEQYRSIGGDYPYRGSSNQRLIDVASSLKENKTIIYNTEED